MKDKAGREIKVGDFIIYGQVWGRSAGLNYGKVLSVGMSKTPDWNDKKVPTLRMVGMSSFTWKGSLLQKPSTLRFSDRVLVVDKKQVSKKAFNALSKFKESK